MQVHWRLLPGLNVSHFHSHFNDQSSVQAQIPSGAQDNAKAFGPAEGEGKEVSETYGSFYDLINEDITEQKLKASWPICIDRGPSPSSPLIPSIYNWTIKTGILRSRSLNYLIYDGGEPQPLATPALGSSPHPPHESHCRWGPRIPVSAMTIKSGFHGKNLD